MKDTAVAPEFSVIIPTFNRARYLAEAIQSVYDDRWESFELIVVDDGSTDGTADVVKGFPDIRYHYQPNQGVAAARNAGISLAKGNIIVFLDSDDLWMPGRFRNSYEYLKEHPDIDFILGLQLMFLEPGYPKPGHILSDMLTKATEAYGTGVMAARKHCFEKVGPFNLLYKTGEDTEWMIRASDRNLKMAFVKIPFIKRRIHPNNLSETDPARKKFMVMQMIRESLKRKKLSDELSTAKELDTQKPD